MAKLEKIFAVLIAIGISFRLFHWDGGAILFLAGTAGLSMLYWPFGFALLNGIRARQLFSSAAYQSHRTGALVLGGVLGLFLATTLMGALFASMHWSGELIMRIIGGAGLLATLLLALMKRQQLALPANGQGWLVRGGIVLLLMLAAPFFPESRPQPVAEAAAVR